MIIEEELELVFPTLEYKTQVEEILENEVYIDNELIQRYWISLNKR